MTNSGDFRSTGGASVFGASALGVAAFNPIPANNKKAPQAKRIRELLYSSLRPDYIVSKPGLLRGEGFGQDSAPLPCNYADGIASCDRRFGRLGLRGARGAHRHLRHHGGYSFGIARPGLSPPPQPNPAPRF